MDKPIKDLIIFPSIFMIKALGYANPRLSEEVVEIVNKYSTTKVSDADISMKASSKGSYVSISVNVFATSKAQLDHIYTDLHKHELIKITL